VAVSPDGRRVYITSPQSATNEPASLAFVIDTATDTVIATVQVGDGPMGVAVSPDDRKVYVGNTGSDTVSVIDTTTNTVVSTIPTGRGPTGVALTPDGSKVYVANDGANTASMINAATNTVTATIPVGIFPIAFGIFIQPPAPPSLPPRFSGTPGKANCTGQSVSALAKQYGGLNNAAATLGYSSVSALQNAIMEYCRV